MRIAYFREFILLSKYLNFSLAAKHLHMTQPGLSRHISALEQELGCTLFERDTHGVRLTENGQHFLKGIEKIIEDYDFLCETTLQGGVEKLTIGVPYFGIKKYLSKTINTFEQSHPQLKINYLPAYPDKIISGLFTKKVDVAFLPKTPFHNHEKLVFHDAFDERLTALIHQDHDLASEKEIEFSLLKNQEFIVLKGNFGDAMFDTWSSLFRKYGFFAPLMKERPTTVEEAALSIKADRGIMLLPGHFKEATLPGNVTCIDIINKDCTITISLVHHPENQNPITQDFIHFYLEQVNKFDHS